MINLGFKRQHQLAEKLKTFFPDETSRKSVKILDVAAGTGLVGVGLKKEGSRDQKTISLIITISRIPLIFVFKIKMLFNFCN